MAFVVLTAVALTAAYGLQTPGPTGVVDLASQAPHSAAPASVGGQGSVGSAVRDSVAARWDTPADRVVLDWGSSNGARQHETAAAVELLGSGTGGYWVASFATRSGEVVRVRVRAGVIRSRPVAARALGRGSVLSADDVTYDAVTEWGPLDAAPEAEAAPGWVTHRVIAEGDVLRSPAVAPAPAVESGRPVEALWRRGAVEVVLQGRALGTAAVGRDVYVRTEDGRRFRGVVQAPGRVLLEPGTRE
jgi:flagella basal body P-ring formation protein FlgA